MSVLILFLLAALTCILAVTYLTVNSKIDIDVVRTFSLGAAPGVAVYNIDSWTTETWY